MSIKFHLFVLSFCCFFFVLFCFCFCFVKKTKDYKSSTTVNYEQNIHSSFIMHLEGNSLPKNQWSGSNNMTSSPHPNRKTVWISNDQYSFCYYQLIRKNCVCETTYFRNVNKLWVQGLCGSYWVRRKYCPVSGKSGLLGDNAAQEIEKFIISSIIVKG